MTEADVVPIDPEFAAALATMTAAERAAQARGFITGFTIATYLRAHVQAERLLDPATNQLEPPAPMEWLACDVARVTWMIRWPNGQTRWESAAALERRGFLPPPTPLLGVVEGAEVA